MIKKNKKQAYSRNIKITGHRKQFRAPFVIYGNLESVLKKTQTIINSKLTNVIINNKVTI